MKKLIYMLMLILSICLAGCTKDNVKLCANVDERLIKQEDKPRYYFRVVVDHKEYDFEVDRKVFMSTKLGEKFCK